MLNRKPKHGEELIIRCRFIDIINKKYLVKIGRESIVINKGDVIENTDEINDDMAGTIENMENMENTIDNINVLTRKINEIDNINVLTKEINKWIGIK